MHSANRFRLSACSLWVAVQGVFGSRYARCATIERFRGRTLVFRRSHLMEKTDHVCDETIVSDVGFSSSYG